MLWCYETHGPIIRSRNSNNIRNAEKSFLKTRSLQNAKNVIIGRSNVNTLKNEIFPTQQINSINNDDEKYNSNNTTEMLSWALGPTSPRDYW